MVKPNAINKIKEIFNQQLGDNKLLIRLNVTFTKNESVYELYSIDDDEILEDDFIFNIDGIYFHIDKDTCDSLRVIIIDYVENEKNRAFVFIEK